MLLILFPMFFLFPLWFFFSDVR
ncbi:hypothetical protein CAEBREN_01810 [Caenorhabditis brenneri]|uniref:Uncharacterized protein n=1 Tax=Caenorhabditis brenneri TaxID=135651 RepID=G0NW83_CAEBE|nr:hypothetical protein CAEBREN_01810 [Caenorhabditis brenneri]